MDTLSVTTETGAKYMILSGKELALGRTYTVSQLKAGGYADLESTSAPLIGRDVLYRNKDIFVDAVENTILTFVDEDHYEKFKQNIKKYSRNLAKNELKMYN